jgi:transposase
MHACIVLLAAEGRQNKEIAKQLGVGRVRVARWRKRYVESGLEGTERR